MNELHSVSAPFAPGKMVLEWRPMSEPPTQAFHPHLLFSACDGYHLVFNYGGKFCEFEDHGSRHPHDPKNYVAWAALPEDLFPEG